MKIKNLLLFLVFCNIITAQQKASSEFKSIEINTNGIYIEKSLPPVLEITKFSFEDANFNTKIDAQEVCYLTFTVINKGKGSARSLNAVLKLNTAISDLNFNAITPLGNIRPNTIQEFKIPIRGGFTINNGQADFTLSFDEAMGMVPEPISYKIPTKAFDSPNVIVADYKIYSEQGTLAKGKPIKLELVIQNIGQGIAEQITVEAKYPEWVNSNQENDRFSFEQLIPGESKQLVFEYIISPKFNSLEIEIPIALTEHKYKRYAQGKTIVSKVNAQTQTAKQLVIQNSNNNTKVDIKRASLNSDVDQNIPENNNKQTQRYALIIGNENYTDYQIGISTEVNVAFAASDAQSFKSYCNATLGIPEANTHLLINATAAKMKSEIELVLKRIEKEQGQGELLFFYAGHGQPDEQSKTPYLMPVDVSANDLVNAMDLNALYEKFGKINAKRITVFLDACFSGGGRNTGMLAARGVRVKPKPGALSGNVMVFAATQAEQVALTYKDQFHGMFTYFLLKGIKENKGRITYQDLANFIRTNVSKTSLEINRREQDPSMLTSPALGDTWKTLKLLD